MPLKIFHSEIQNDHEAIAQEEAAYKPIPNIATVTDEDVRENYLKIKREVHELMVDELRRIEAEMPTEENSGQPVQTPKEKKRSPKKRSRPIRTTEKGNQQPPAQGQREKNTDQQNTTNRPTSM